MNIIRVPDGRGRVVDLNEYWVKLNPRRCVRGVVTEKIRLEHRRFSLIRGPHCYSIGTQSDTRSGYAIQIR